MTARRRTGFLSAVRGTLRLRVTVVAALAVLGVLSVTSIGLVLVHHHALVAGLDEILDQHADTLEARLRSGQPVLDRDLPTDDVQVQLVGADGTVLAASRIWTVPSPGVSLGPVRSPSSCRGARGSGGSSSGTSTARRSGSRAVSTTPTTARRLSPGR